MMLAIPDLLDPEGVARIRAIVDAGEWVDGNVTAGHQSARAKDNLQLPEDCPAARQIGEVILAIRIFGFSYSGGSWAPSQKAGAHTPARAASARNLIGRSLRAGASEVAPPSRHPERSERSRTRQA